MRRSALTKTARLRRRSGTMTAIDTNHVVQSMEVPSIADRKASVTPYMGLSMRIH